MCKRVISIRNLWAIIALAAAGCASHRHVAIVLTDSSSGKPIEASVEIKRVVDQESWTFGPFGRTYESDFARSSMPGDLQYITVGDRDVLNVNAPGYEATRLQFCGKTAFVIRGESENLFQAMVDRAWVDRDVARKYALSRKGIVSIPLNPKSPTSSPTTEIRGYAPRP